MTRVKKYGDMNSHAMDIIVRDLVRRAMKYIREHRFDFTVYDKIGPDGAKDVFTNVDRSAQEMYVKTLRACFPLCGIIAEEDGVMIKSTHAHDLYFSIDPLDGTKAFIRKQSHGIGSMISLSDGDEIIAAYVGDVMTGEIYGFHEASGVLRYTEDGECVELFINEQHSLNDQKLLLDDPPDDSAVLIRQMAKGAEHGGLFKTYEISSGGIGLVMARLWKGEIGGVILRTGHDAPWDLNPVVGISKKMGFTFIGILHDDSIREESMSSLTTTMERHYETLVIHKSRWPEFVRWCGHWSRTNRMAFDPRVAEIESGVHQISS